MRHATLLATLLVAIVLAACSVTGQPEPSADPSSPPASPSPSPAEPTATPTPEPSTSPTPAPSESAGRETGTITVVDGLAAGGPGISVADAIDSGITAPVQVRGILLMDPQGRIYVCDTFAGGGAPTCGEPMLEVIGYPSMTDWDLANAEVTGLQEAEGVRFFLDALIFGVVEP